MTFFNNIFENFGECGKRSSHESPFRTFRSRCLSWSRIISGSLGLSLQILTTSPSRSRRLWSQLHDCYASSVLQSASNAYPWKCWKAKARIEKADKLSRLKYKSNHRLRETTSLKISESQTIGFTGIQNYLVPDVRHRHKQRRSMIHRAMRKTCFSFNIFTVSIACIEYKWRCVVLLEIDFLLTLKWLGALPITIT